MSGVLIVDWLGRGGIADCTAAWVAALEDGGAECTIVTRPGRSLDRLPPVRPSRNRIVAHRSVGTRAARIIEETRPSVVVVQNYIAPLLERPVYEAARRAGAQLVFVVHDHRPHSRWAGATVGFDALIGRADMVVAHSHFVADALRTHSGRRVEVVPVPRQTRILDSAPSAVPFEWDRGKLLALHFGVLHRRYKGTDLVLELGRPAPPGWEIGVVGAGAPVAAGLPGVDRFVTDMELRASLVASSATVLPYRWATQSGAVTLAQHLGSVVVATAVGGVAEQIEDGVTGRLLPVGATAAGWRRVLDELIDDDERARLATNAKVKVTRDDMEFRSFVRALQRVRA